MLGIIVTSLFVALFVRLLFLQVIDAPQLAAAARENQVRTVYNDAPRGRILDTNGEVLAGNREVDVLTVDRAAVRRDETLLPRLAQFLGIEVATLRQRLADPKASPYRPVAIATNVDKATIASFQERSSDFVGAATETRIERYYPGGSLAAHVLGYVGEVNDRELAARQTDSYRLGDDIGKSGIELSMEKDLRGTPGVDRVEVDSSGRVMRVLDHRPPAPGRDVVLAIDKSIQVAAEQALREGLEAARGSANNSVVGTDGLPAAAGSTVAIDPVSGSVRAMASYPTFDPNSFADGIGVSEYARLTDPANYLPLNNRAVQGQYAPGSTFKLVTALAAVKAGVITPETVVNDTGAFTLGNRRYQNALGASFGPVNLPRALSVSSDVYFYQLGARFWDRREALGDPMQATAEQFGFGRTQGIAIGGEQPGRVPDPASRQRLHQQRPDAYPEGNWYAGDNVNLSIGQGDTLVTPLQLANSYATFANGGTLYRPRLVEAVRQPAGSVIRKVEPEVLGTADMPASAQQAVAAGLTGAVQQPGGTAFGAFRDFDFGAFPVAGKTGTAQVTGKADSALFAGYGPVGNPRLSVSVVLEEAGFGGAVAAPVARRVLAAAAGQSTAQVSPGTSTD